MKYGYVRVSSKDQNLARQIYEMKKIGLSDSQIYIEKESGKDFNRPTYQLLKSILKAGDVLFIKSIDRLGRNYDMIIEEWKTVANKQNVDICVLDMPLLDTRIGDKKLIGRFVSDIVLQVLSFVAENERENIKKRQAEGIRIARLEGKHLGRPKYNLSEEFFDIIGIYKNNKITLSSALTILNMNKSTFYKYYKLYA